MKIVWTHQPRSHSSPQGGMLHTGIPICRPPPHPPTVSPTPNYKPLVKPAPSAKIKASASQPPSRAHAPTYKPHVKFAPSAKISASASLGLSSIRA